MRNFHCVCDNRLFFDNTRCLVCGRDTGFVPEAGVLSPLEPGSAGRWRALEPAVDGKLFRRCANSEHDVCNWMIPAHESETFCQACDLNQIIPDLSEPENRRYWKEIEKAKRRLIYTLNALRLPIAGKRQDPVFGLGFAFLADPQPALEFSDQLGRGSRVLTGHDGGLITINVAEADDVERERTRKKMGERYRTLLGHFRHEIGHYYWLRLVKDGPELNACRALFGDERSDYAAALASYYANGPCADWPTTFISAYASAHPWEDWAESFAHYLHMVDTLEAARELGFTRVCPIPAGDFDALADAWIELTIGLNELNRCMGQQDVYPFVLSERPREKLRQVHRVIASAGDSARDAAQA